MSKLVILSLAGVAGSLATLLSSKYHSIPFSLTSTSIWTLLSYFTISLVWGVCLYPFYFSPLRSIPRGPRVSWKQFLTPTNANQVLEMVDNIPNEGFIRYLDMFNTEIVTLTDPKAIAEFFSTAKYDNYRKPPKFRRILESILGYGLVTSEGANHKYQRKNIIPAFNAKVIKGLNPLFWRKGVEMISLIKKDISSQSDSIINVNEYAGRAALDIIGEAGFGLDFDSLAKPDTPLNVSYRASFVPNKSSGILFLIALMTTPKLVNILPSRRAREIRDGVAVITAFLANMIAERKIKMEKDVEKHIETEEQKDIISNAMRTGAFDTANLVEQSKTLLGAGHETSATAITWASYALSLPENLAIQTRLRAEIHANLPSPSSSTPPTFETLDKLPYLDAVTKEVLRVYSPIPMIGRVAKVDTTILGQRIPKGTNVRMQVWAINRAKHLWGEDAREFKPERWLGDQGMEGGKADGMSFLTFGHGMRGCIGRGFAIAEFKALLSNLIGTFELKSITKEGAEPSISWGIAVKLLGGYEVEAKVVKGW